MEPLSITASIVGLTATCVAAVKSLHDIKDKYHNASLTISAICTEATVISASLSKIQSIVLESPSRISNNLGARPDLASALDQALTGCFVVLDVLQGEVRKLTDASEVAKTDYGKIEQLQYLWNESSMQDILGHIRGLQTALTLLLQLFGTDAISDIQRIMEDNTAVLTKLVERNVKFRKQRTSQAPGSIFDISFVVQSMRSGDSESMISSTLFTFDDAVINSQVYRRVLAKARAKSRSSSQERDESRTITDDKVDIADPADPSEPAEEQNTALEIAGQSSQPASRGPEVLSGKVFEPRDLDAKDAISTATSSFLAWLSARSDCDEREEHWLIKRKVSLARQHALPEEEVQKILHMIIRLELMYLERLQIMRYLYRTRAILEEFSANKQEENLAHSQVTDLFPGFDDLHRANRTLLYEPLKASAMAESPQVRTCCHIFQNWLPKSRQFYIEYASSYSTYKHQIELEIKLNKPFRDFLKHSEKVSKSWVRRSGWYACLTSPFNQLPVYIDSFEIILTERDSSPSYHYYREGDRLVGLIKSIQLLMLECQTSANGKIDFGLTRHFENWVGEAKAIVPSSAVIKFKADLIWRETMMAATFLHLKCPEDRVFVYREAPHGRKHKERHYCGRKYDSNAACFIEDDEKESTGPCWIKLFEISADSKSLPSPCILHVKSRFTAFRIDQIIVRMGGFCSTKPSIMFWANYEWNFAEAKGLNIHDLDLLMLREGIETELGEAILSHAQQGV